MSITDRGNEYVEILLRHDIVPFAKFPTFFLSAQTSSSKNDDLLRFMLWADHWATLENRPYKDLNGNLTPLEVGQFMKKGEQLAEYGFSAQTMRRIVRNLERNMFLHCESIPGVGRIFTVFHRLPVHLRPVFVSKLGRNSAMISEHLVDDVNLVQQEGRTNPNTNPNVLYNKTENTHTETQSRSVCVFSGEGQGSDGPVALSPASPVEEVGDPLFHFHHSLDTERKGFALTISKSQGELLRRRITGDHQDRAIKHLIDDVIDWLEANPSKQETSQGRHFRRILAFYKRNQSNGLRFFEHPENGWGFHKAPRKRKG
jgi:hypothetical protein